LKQAAMSHDHNHEPLNFNRAFAIGTILNLGFVAVEAVYGIVADSLALLADAGHNLSDVLGLLLAWGAHLLARRKATPRRTYGFRRATILAALISAIVLLLALGGIGWEAIERFRHPQPVHAVIVMVVAGAGVVVNTVTALLFLSGRKHDLNIKGAFLHMAADAAVSVGVVIAGLAILYTGWLWLDPAISLAVVLIILIGTWGLLRDSIDLAVDAVPKAIDPDKVREYLASLPGVTAVHDFHVWGMSTTQAALTVHLVMPEGSGGDAFLYGLAHQLDRRFGIGHSTVQIERGDPEIECRQVASLCR
jgi:cobalt-zinc-cadmium efflux system protein